MSYGLVQSGHKFRDESMQGLRDVAALEKSREQTNESLKQQKKQTETSAMVGGATAGAMIGAKYGTAAMPGWGTLIGAGVGAVAGWLLS